MENGRVELKVEKDDVIPQTACLKHKLYTIDTNTWGLSPSVFHAE